MPHINAKVKNGMFVFDIKYTSASQDINATGTIDIHTNELKFDIHQTEDNIHYTDVVLVFEGLKPHIQLRCDNKKCKMNYYYCSNSLVCERASKRWNGHYYNYADYTRIRPFLSYYEACNIDKYWVQTDNIYGMTRIISTANPDSDPITIDPINFSSFDKDRLKTRILTIVTFG